MKPGFLLLFARGVLVTLFLQPVLRSQACVLSSLRFSGPRDGGGRPLFPVLPLFRPNVDPVIPFFDVPRRDPPVGRVFPRLIPKGLLS